ncbi:MAG: ATP-binding cassette domain-containing protein [bacterium]|nr:ATP-binding cassette domain-containing protein [bacterium]
MSSEKETARRIGYIKRLAPYLWEFRGRIGASLAFLTLARLLTLLDPYIIKEVIDMLVDGHVALFGLTAPMLIGVFLAVRIVSSIFEGFIDLVMVKAETGMKQRIGLEVFAHMLSLSIAFHTDRSIGGMARKITRGTEAINHILWMFSTNIIPTLLELLFVTIVFVKLFPPIFAIVLLITAISHIAYTIFLTENRQVKLLEMYKLDDRAGSKIVDSLLNYESVKYFNNEQYEYRSYQSRLKEWVVSAIKTGRSGVVINIGQGIILACGLTALLYLAYQQYLVGASTVGDFVLITAYLGRIGVPLSFLGFVYRRAKEGLASLDEMIRLLEEPITVKDIVGAKNLVVSEGAIIFDNVSFAYNDEREVLKHLNLSIPARERIAFVGYSGSGKSTITKLLARFYDPTEGAIRVDGQNIAQVTQESLRQNLGVVAQDAVLFNASIRENILYGRTDATEAEIEEAARRASIHDFISKELPNGYETIVGERGIKLSGGEKQRVAIARMLLKNPAILMFDEATASLDTESEREIQASIQEVSGDAKTTIVIAHRLSTIVDFDRIIVFDKGRIAEEGSHDDLLKKGGHYAKLWQMQLKHDNE